MNEIQINTKQHKFRLQYTVWTHVTRVTVTVYTRFTQSQFTHHSH